MQNSSGIVPKLINCQKASENFVKNSLPCTKDEQKQIDLEEKHQDEDLSFQSIFSISIIKVEEGAGEDRSKKRGKVDEQKNEGYSGE